jgi:hypothetical protein
MFSGVLADGRKLIKGTIEGDWEQEMVLPRPQLDKEPDLIQGIRWREGAY